MWDTKEQFMICVDEITEELHPDGEYYDLPREEQYRIDDLAWERVRDKIADIADEGKDRRKYARD